VRLVAGPLREGVLVHVDLHETTDSDEAEFSSRGRRARRQAVRAGRDPDGFYVVDDRSGRAPNSRARVIAAVARVTHIAPPDADGQIIGTAAGRARCHSVSGEASRALRQRHGRAVQDDDGGYPDSPRTSPEECNVAQATAVCAAIEFALVRARER